MGNKPITHYKMEIKSYSEYSSEVACWLKDLKLPEEDYPTLYSPISYALDCGGKRLRPVLAAMACNAMGGDSEAVKNAAIGLEMFHNFTLLHDDVMDNSDMRRNRPTVHTKWGVNSAILSGDAMLTLATELVANVEDSKLRSVLTAFNEGALRVYEGQALDMAFETRNDVSTEEYIKMIGLKTGALLGTAAKIGALVGGADTKTADSFYEYGYKLGLAFQIYDDYLDVYGDTTMFGKPIGGDILNNKKTYLLVEGLSKGDKDSQALRSAMEMEASPLKVKTVTHIYDSMNLGEACRKATASYTGQALKALKKADIPQEWRDAFKHLAEKLTDRKK